MVVVCVCFFFSQQQKIQQFIIEEGANNEDIHDMDIIVTLLSYSPSSYVSCWMLATQTLHFKILYIAFGAKSVILIQSP